jgi:hypothetical protein
VSDLKSSWVVHVVGPDDVLPQPDEITALREANALNKAMLDFKTKRPDNDVLCVAVAKDAAVEAV